MASGRIYALIITAIYNVIAPESVEFKHYINAILPVATNRHWYFTAYFGMFFFIPFFNRLLETLKRKDALRLVITLVVVLSVFPTLFNKDLFNTGLGFSVLWISALYLIGGYCKKYAVHDNYTVKKSVFMYVGAVLFSWGIKHLISFADFRFQDGSRNVDVLIQYTSPTMLLAAFSLFVLFAKMNIHNKCAVRLIRFFVPLSFGVYILHTNPVIWNHVLTDCFSSYGNFPAPLLIVSVLGTALGIYLICSLTDWVRLKLFQILRVNQLCCLFTGKIHKLLAKVLPIG